MLNIFQASKLTNEMLNMFIDNNCIKCVYITEDAKFSPFNV